MCGAICFLKMKCVSALLIRSCRHLLSSNVSPLGADLVVQSRMQTMNTRQYAFFEWTYNLWGTSHTRNAWRPWS